MNELVQVGFDYSLVNEEQASQLQTIYDRVLIRHMSTAYEDGKDMLEAKNIKNLPYKVFIAWAYTAFGWNETAINQKINVASNFGITPPGGVIADKAMYLLSTKRVPETAREEAKQRASNGEEITEEVAKQIRDAHKAKEEAEEAERQARDETKLAQQQLFNEQSKSKEQTLQLNQQIEALKKEMEDLSKPEEVIKEVDKPETKARLEKLETDIATLTQQRDNLSKLADELSADLNANEAQREQETRALRIRQEWKTATSAVHKSLIKFLGQLPIPVDTQMFEADDWGRFEEVVQACRILTASYDKLHASPALMIVDAR